VLLNWIHLLPHLAKPSEQSNILKQILPPLKRKTFWLLLRIELKGQAEENGAQRPSGGEWSSKAKRRRMEEANPGGRI